MPRPKKPGPNANRTDLTSVPTGRAYGARQSYESAASTPEARAAVAPTPGAPGPAGGGGGADLAAALASFTAGPPSTLAAPSTRPGEPVTSGLARGPGGGPESTSPLVRQQGPNPDVVAWRRYMPMLELLATRADSSTEIRQLVRRLRAQLPVDPFNQPRPS